MNGAIDYREPVTVRTAAILTNAYVAGTVIGGETTGEKSKTNEYNQLILYVTFTIGSLTSASIKVEFSNDNSTYYQETAMSISGGTVTESLAIHTISASGNYRICIPMNDRYVKISAIGTGTVTSSSMGIKAVLGVN
jgi:hypothetical protein